MCRGKKKKGRKTRNKHTWELGTELTTFDIPFNEPECKESCTHPLLQRKKNYSSYLQYVIAFGVGISLLSHWKIEKNTHCQKQPENLHSSISARNRRATVKLNLMLIRAPASPISIQVSQKHAPRKKKLIFTWRHIK